jgi:protein TonB
LIHIVILALAVILSTFTGQYKKVMVVDFDLRKPAPDVKKVEPAVPTPSIKTKSMSPTARQISEEKEPPRLTEERAAVPETPPVVKLPEAHNLESRPMGLGMPSQATVAKEGSPGITGGAKAGVGNVGGGKESARTKYLNDHFTYIRDKILRNVSYPDKARRMGWQGKVLLSFIITAEGAVKAFKIIQSSGFTILDKSAIESVREAAPFPKPPVEAQLVIPIIYRLG